MRPLLLLWALLFGMGCSLVTDHYAECQGSAQCPAGRFCVQNYCVAVNCAATYGQADAGNAIWLGAALPLTNATGKVDQAQAVDFEAFVLALNEVNQRGVGGRPFAITECDTQNDPVLVNNAINYLVAQKRIAAVLTSHSSQALAATPNAVSQGVLVMSATATSPELSTLNASVPVAGGGTVRMLWRTAPSDVIQGQVIANLITRNDAVDGGYPYLRNVHRLGIFYENDPYGQGLAHAVQRALGSSGSSLTVGAFQYTAGQDTSAVVAQLDTFHPDLTLAIGFPSDLIPVLVQAAQRPNLTHHQDGSGHRWFFTDSAEADALLADPIALGQVQGALGSAPAQGAGLGYQTFAASFRTQYSVDPSTTAFTSHSYDAMYLLALGAASAVGPGPAYSGAVTGPRIALGLTHVSEGAPFELGPTDFTPAAAALEQGTSINVAGASGSLDFNPLTGEAPSPISIWQISGTTISTLTTLPPP